MLGFRYVAKNASGKKISGVIEAENKKAAIDLLRKKDLTIILLEEASTGPSLLKGGKISFLKKVSVDDLVVFSRQLATMVEAGIPLVNVLDMLGEQMEKPFFKEVILKIRDDIEAGASFSEAISKQKRVFSTLFINMVKAGETSGTLDEILDRVATYMEKMSNLQKKIRSALIYPAVVMTMAIAVTLVLIIKVIPVFKEIYSGFGAALPTPTQILIDVSDAVRRYFIIVVGLLGLMVFALSRLAKTDKGRYFFDKLKLKVPIFGPLIRKVAISKFTRTFSTLIKSGVPILASLDIVGKTSGNMVVEKAVEDVKTNVRDGENIAEPLARSGIFPPMVVRMVSVGEKSGELEKMLTKVSEFYDAQVDTAVSGLTSMIEPLIIAFLGVIIGTIVICMFLPIFRISEIVSF